MKLNTGERKNGSSEKIIKKSKVTQKQRNKIVKIFNMKMKK